jgi:hypothetical protein
MAIEFQKQYIDGVEQTQQSIAEYIQDLYTTTDDKLADKYRH